MKHTARKLLLVKRETVRAIRVAELDRVIGGVVEPQVDGTGAEACTSHVSFATRPQG
jgi:hypothetical protein